MNTDFILRSGVTVASPVVVRVAGLPVAALERLRFGESFSQACEIVRLRGQLSVEGDALSGMLHEVIGASPDGAGKAALVGLRRAVFGLRWPAGREWNERVAAVLPGSIAERLGDWISTLGECERLSARLPATLSAETEAKQAVLREIVGHRGFQRALSQASPALSGEAAKWLAAGARAPQRQSLIRLAKYAARAAAKTSPYSTFTISGAGTWSEHGLGGHVTEHGRGGHVTEPVPVECVLELSGFLLARLTGALCGDPRLSPRLGLRVNPSATLHGDTVRFLGPPPHEPIVTVPATPAVRECLRMLDGAACYTTADLRDLLEDGDPGDGRVGRFLAHLVDAGLLERQLPVADLAADPLGELAGWLTANGGDDFADAVALIDGLRWQLRNPAPVRDVAGHGARQRELGDAIGGLAQRAGLAPGLRAERDRDMLHENAVFAGPVGEFSMPAWRPALEDLDVVRRVLAALDPALPLRVALGAYCAERFGPGSRVPFLALHEAIAADLSRGVARGQSHAARKIAGFLRLTAVSPGRSLGDSRLARLRELGRIREGLRRVLPSPADTDGVIRADPGVLAMLSATWPEWVTAPRSVAYYLQVMADEESPRLVVNVAHGGHGRGRSRALHLISQAGGTVPRDQARGARRGATGSEPALAEFGGRFGYSPNVRLASVPYEIDYPFTVSRRPAEQRIPVSDLEVVHDCRTGLAHLAARGLKSEVKALHLGMMADALLPPAARLMTQAFGAGYLMHPSMPLLTSPGPWSVPQTVLAVARVEIGRVVVRRARWVAPAAQVPVRGKGEPDAGYLVRVVAWLGANRIPTRCFVRAFAADPQAAAAEPATRRLFDKSRKPVYVDFANWYLVLAFERMLKGAGSVVIFEEALPAPEDALALDRADPSVAEFIVEISEPEVSDV